MKTFWVPLDCRQQRKLETHDEAIRSLMNAIRQLMTPQEPKRRSIGFLVGEPEDNK